MAVLVYTGRPGVGKTLTVVDELYRLKKQQTKLGKTFAVFSNVRGLKVEGLEVVDFTQYFTSGLFLRQFKVNREYSWLNENQLLELQQLWMCFVPLGSLILLDEIQNLYPSADRKLSNLKFEDVDLSYLLEKNSASAMDCLKKGPFFNISVDDLPLGPRHFFEKHRHYGYNVLGTCQNPAQLGKFLRSITQETIHITNGDAFGLSNYRQYVHYNSEGQKIRTRYQWFTRAKRKLLFSSYQSEFEKGLAVSKKFSPKLMFYISFILLTLMIGLYIFWAKLDVYKRFWNEGSTFLINDKLKSNQQQVVQTTGTIKVKEDKTKSSSGSDNPIKTHSLITWFIENQYTFEYHGYLREILKGRERYLLDLQACNPEGVCFDLEDSSELKKVGILVKPLTTCFLQLKDQKTEIFIGCKLKEKEEAKGKLLLSTTN